MQAINYIIKFINFLNVAQNIAIFCATFKILQEYNY